jgi:nicotinate-nucleotide adenylyltransferase
MVIMSMKNRNLKGGIGILGGTFDPIHLGHFEVARAVKEHYELGSIFIIPTYMNPLRIDQKISAGLDDRLIMAHLATLDESWLWVDSIEIDRGREHGEVSYTIETLQDFRQKYPEYPLIQIVGSDNVAFHKWARIGEFPIFLDKIAVVSRPEYGEKMEAELAQVREMYPEVAELIEFLPLVDNPASSTYIRESFQDGFIPSNALYPEVERYIRKYGLYGTKAEPY